MRRPSRGAAACASTSCCSRWDSAGWLGWFDLPEHLRILSHPLVLGASGFMSFVEFFADKLPWVDSLWDAVHSFIRIPAGAALAAAVFGDSGAATALAAALLGGGIAAGAHLAKAAGRTALNASPEPFTNWAASFTEDAMVPLGLWLAVAHPLLFLALLVAFLVAASTRRAGADPGRGYVERAAWLA